jgi:[acyl-carrier-protein] S-malonyltransferase
VVIAGARDAVARAGERAKALGAKRVDPLPVSAPFHCALMKPAKDRLAPELRALPTRRRACRSSPTSTPSRSATRGGDRGAGAPGVVAGALGGGRQRLASEGVTTYVEVGPGTC